jgi:hypothetical protein
MEKNAKFFQEQAERCRRLARQLTDRELAKSLLALGEEYAEQASAWDDATAGRRRQRQGIDPRSGSAH